MRKGFEQVELMFDTYVDSVFLSDIGTLLPAVGVGVVIGFLGVIIGWLIGFIWRAGSDKL